MGSGFVLSQADGRPMYLQIIEQIKRRIAVGDWKAGELIPSIRQLAADLQVSVITVKRAYEDLERKGIIYRRQGLGTFVAKAAADRSREAKTERARALMRDAVREASEAGLGPRDLHKLFESILEDERESRHVRKRG